MFDSSADITPIALHRPVLDATVRVDRRALLGRALEARRHARVARPSPLLMAWARLRLERGDNAAQVLADCLDDERLCGVHFAHGMRVGGVVVTHLDRRSRVAVMVFEALSSSLRSSDVARVAALGLTPLVVGLDEFSTAPHRVLSRIAGVVAAAS